MRDRFLRWFRVISFVGLLGAAAIYAVFAIAGLAAGHDDHAKTDLYIFFTLGTLACFALAPGTDQRRV